MLPLKFIIFNKSSLLAHLQSHRRRRRPRRRHLIDRSENIFVSVFIIIIRGKVKTSNWRLQLNRCCLLSSSSWSSSSFCASSALANRVDEILANLFRVVRSFVRHNQPDTCLGLSWRRATNKQTNKLRAECLINFHASC